MNRTELLDAIATKADIESHTDVERAAVETLRTLGEHVSEGEAEDIAAALPQDLGAALTSHPDDHPEPERFSPEEFAARVAERERSDVHADEAMMHARATLTTIADHGDGSILGDAREQLPSEFDTIFEEEELRGE